MSTEFYNPEEVYSRSEIEALQLERLRATVSHCMNSGFYKARFDSIGLRPQDIRTLDDLNRIPFTTKQDLRDTYPFGIASVPLKDCTRLHSSSAPPAILRLSCTRRKTWSNGPMRWHAACGW